VTALKIPKDQITALLAVFLERYRVLTPVEENGQVRFGRLESPQDAVLDYRNTQVSPKWLFFPQTETLFTYNLTGKTAELQEGLQPGDAQVVFGIRPCDARSFVLLDRVFDGNAWHDEYYLSRRRNTTVIALACPKPGLACFCGSVGGGPFSTEGSDLLLTDLGQEYLLEVVTAKGTALAETLSQYGEADESSLQRKAQLQQGAEAAMATRVEIEGIDRRLKGMWDDDFWERLHEKCLGCGVCTYLCPTCHCFDILDEGSDCEGQRLRLWDSCMFPLFTRQASGHDPRPTGKERWRQRLMHKFCYSVESYAEVGCVGCGRCVVNCPVNLDLRRVLGEICSDRIQQRS
jgi:sulfhydrogenase subunit beta (sulfur reductase)